MVQCWDGSSDGPVFFMFGGELEREDMSVGK